MHIKLFGKAYKPAKELTNLHYVHSRKNCWHERERNEVVQISENNHNFRIPLKITSGFNCSGKDTFCVKTILKFN